MEVGKTALAEGSYEIERHGGAIVAHEEATRIGSSSGEGKRSIVDEVAPVAWECIAIDRFEILGAGFGVLTGHATDTNDSTAGSENDGKTHLQKDFEFARDGFGLAIVEGLGAITTLKEPSVPDLGFGDLVFEVIDFPAGNEGGHFAERRQDALQERGIVVRGLLGSRELLPGGRIPSRTHPTVPNRLRRGVN